VRFLDGSDPAGVKPAALPSRRPDVGAVYPSLRALRHGESAAVEIWWSNWCGSPSPTKLALELSTGTLVLPVDFSSRCDAPKISSTLSYGPLQPVAEQPNRASRLPLAAEIMEQLPGLKHVPGVRGRPGGTAVFHIVLTNTSGRPFRFGADCPTYVEGTGLDEPSQLHVLNCRPVALIGPRQSVVFEMRIRVPANATGSIALTWTLAPTTYEPPFVGGVILVER